MSALLINFISQICLINSIWIVKERTELDHTTKTPDQEDIKLRESDFFTMFLEKLFKYIFLMPDRYAQDIFEQLEPVVDNLLQSNKILLKQYLPRPLLTEIRKLPSSVVRRPVNQSKYIFGWAANLIRIRRTALSKLLNAILSFMNRLYQTDVRKRMLKDLNDFKYYPNITQNSYQLLQNTILDSILTPFSKMNNQNKRLFGKILNKYVLHNTLENKTSWPIDLRRLTEFQHIDFNKLPINDFQYLRDDKFKPGKVYRPSQLNEKKPFFRSNHSVYKRTSSRIYEKRFTRYNIQNESLTTNAKVYRFLNTTKKRHNSQTSSSINSNKYFSKQRNKDILRLKENFDKSIKMHEHGTKYVKTKKSLIRQNTNSHKKLKQHVTEQANNRFTNKKPWNYLSPTMTRKNKTKHKNYDHHEITQSSLRNRIRNHKNIASDENTYLGKDYSDFNKPPKVKKEKKMKRILYIVSEEVLIDSRDIEENYNGKKKISDTDLDIVPPIVIKSNKFFDKHIRNNRPKYQEINIKGEKNIDHLLNKHKVHKDIFPLRELLNTQSKKPFGRDLLESNIVKTAVNTMSQHLLSNLQQSSVILLNKHNISTEKVLPSSTVRLLSNSNMSIFDANSFLSNKNAFTSQQITLPESTNKKNNLIFTGTDFYNKNNLTQQKSLDTINGNSNSNQANQETLTSKTEKNNLFSFGGFLNTHLIKAFVDRNLSAPLSLAVTAAVTRPKHSLQNPQHNNKTEWRDQNLFNKTAVSVTTTRLLPNSFIPGQYNTNSVVLTNLQITLSDPNSKAFTPIYSGIDYYKNLNITPQGGLGTIFSNTTFNQTNQNRHLLKMEKFLKEVHHLKTKHHSDFKKFIKSYKKMTNRNKNLSEIQKYEHFANKLMKRFVNHKRTHVRRNLQNTKHKRFTRDIDEFDQNYFISDEGHQTSQKPLKSMDELKTLNYKYDSSRRKSIFSKKITNNSSGKSDKSNDDTSPKEKQIDTDEKHALKLFLRDAVLQIVKKRSKPTQQDSEVSENETNSDESSVNNEERISKHNS